MSEFANRLNGIADEAHRQATGGFSATSEALTALELIRRLAIEVRLLATQATKDAQP